MNLYQTSDGHLYLSSEQFHVTCHHRQSHCSPVNIEKLPKDTLVRVDGRLFTISELIEDRQAKAKSQNTFIDSHTSIWLRGAKVVPVYTNKAVTLRYIIMDKVADGQHYFYYDQFAHDYTQSQFKTAFCQLRHKTGFFIKRHNRASNTLGYYVTMSLPKNHQEITNLGKHKASSTSNVAALS